VPGLQGSPEGAAAHHIPGASLGTLLGVPLDVRRGVPLDNQQGVPQDIQQRVHQAPLDSPVAVVHQVVGVHQGIPVVVHQGSLAVVPLDSPVAELPGTRQGVRLAAENRDRQMEEPLGSQTLYTLL